MWLGVDRLCACSLLVLFAGEAMFTSEVRLDLQPARAAAVITTYAKGAHGFVLDKYTTNLGILFIYAMALRALAYVILLRKKRVKLGRALI